MTGLAVTDVVVATAATFTGVIDVNDADIVNLKVGAGYVTSLYDSTGVVGINTQHMLSTNADNTLSWKEPAQIGIATINPADDVWYVDTHGLDAYDASRGRTKDRPFKTVRYALSRISNRYEHTYNGGTATNAVNVQSGAESGNQQSPNAATYDALSGRLTLSFASAHGMTTGDTLSLIHI